MSKKKERRIGVNNPLGGDSVLQIEGLSDISVKSVRAKCLDALESDEALCAANARVNAIDVYVKPAEGKAYYVARTSAGEVAGSIDLS